MRDLLRGVRIGAQMWWEATSERPLIIFATALFYQKLRPLIDYLHNSREAPTIVWFSGGIVHEAIFDLPLRKRNRIVSSLRTIDRVIVETGEVRDGLRELGITNTLSLPNPRVIAWDDLPDVNRSSERDSLKLLYFSRVVAEKGVFVLADAVRRARDGGAAVELDIYGPVAEKDRDTLQDVVTSQGVQYCGVFEEDAVELMTEYDILGLPTWFEGEGHPGVIVEAMMAGVPVLSTYHKAIPELIADGENGFLVDPKNPKQVTSILSDYASRPDRLRQLGRAHRERLQQHDAASAARRIRDEINNIRAESAN